MNQSIAKASHLPSSLQKDKQVSLTHLTYTFYHSHFNLLSLKLNNERYLGRHPAAGMEKLSTTFIEA